MNDEHIERILSSLAEIEAPKHRTALRTALLREHVRTRRHISPLQLFYEISTMQKTLIPLSTFAVVALVLVGTLGLTHKSAEAQELVQRSMARAVRLTPEMRTQIEAKLKADMMQTLKDAYAAPDLRILTKEEYEKESQFTVATSVPRMGNDYRAKTFEATSDAEYSVGEAGSFTVSTQGPLARRHFL